MRKELIKEATVLMKKEAFVGVTPFTPNPESEYKDVNNYLREYGNRLASSALGVLPGGVLTVIGVSRGHPGLTAVGAGTTLAGAIVGDYKGLRKHEREHNPEAKLTGPGQYLGRNAGSLVGSAVIPIFGGMAGDYLVSRHLQDKALDKKND